MRDPYQILGVKKTATAEEIKAAYRALAKKLHPDLNPGKKEIEQKFKEVTAAYDLLSDATTRGKFDRGEMDAMGNDRGFGGRRPPGGDPFAAHNFGGGFQGPRGGQQDPFSHFSDDLFADLFGGGRKRGTDHPRDNAQNKGADVTYALTVGFVDACMGIEQKVTLSSGKTVKVLIPAGTEDGAKLRLRDQGQAGNGSGSGDAIIAISVAAHPYFSRKNRDIYLETPIGIHEAILGAQITVPTLDGSVAVKVPPHSNSGTLLRLKRRGIPASGGSHAGDFFVRLKVILPEAPQPTLHDFIEKWSKKHAYDPREKIGWEK
jgi:DnaJ-class molecular chaperone